MFLRDSGEIQSHLNIKKVGWERRKSAHWNANLFLKIGSSKCVKHVISAEIKYVENLLFCAAHITKFEIFKKNICNLEKHNFSNLWKDFQISHFKRDFNLICDNEV